MSALAQLIHQARYDLLMFRRNPAASFFTVILPLLFFVILTSVFGNSENEAGVRLATYYVPGILALEVTSATLVNLAITFTSRRERGVLKRVRGTPLRPWVLLAAQALAAFAITMLSAVLLLTIGYLAFDVSLRPEGIPSLLITLFIGAGSLAVLGLALTAVIPSEEAAPAITNVIVLPLYFFSDVFIISDRPELLELIANVFPVQHLAVAFGESFDPLASGTPWPWQHWLVLAAWGAGGTVAALLSFRWVPRR